MIFYQDESSKPFTSTWFDKNSLLLSDEVPTAVGHASPFVFLAAQDTMVRVPLLEVNFTCPGPGLPLVIITSVVLATGFLFCFFNSSTTLATVTFAQVLPAILKGVALSSKSHLLASAATHFIIF